jgi:hypothetical protein
VHNETFTLIKRIDSLSSTQLNVSWQMPNPQMVNGKLKAFKLIYFSIDLLDDLNVVLPLLNNRTKFSFSSANMYLYQQQDEWRTNENLASLVRNDLIDTVVVEPWRTHIVLNNLVPFTNYTCLIQLINQCCESSLKLDELVSSKNRWLMAQTQQSIPDRPALLAFTYVSYTFLNVTWLRPLKPNGVIVAYELWYVASFAFYLLLCVWF